MMMTGGGDMHSARSHTHYTTQRTTKTKTKTPTKTKQKVKLAISHALAQCTKLSVYEERITDLVLATKHLPESLAADGTVKISRKQIARLIGTVFLQRASVNLLSTVLDTPEFFWSAPDHLQVAVGVCVRVSCVCVLTLVGAWGGRRCLLAFSWLLCRFPQFHKHTPKKQNTPHKHNTTNNTNPKTLYERACEYLELETRGELSWAEFVCGGG